MRGKLEHVRESTVGWLAGWLLVEGRGGGRLMSRERRLFICSAPIFLPSPRPGVYRAEGRVSAGSRKYLTAEGEWYRRV